MIKGILFDLDGTLVDTLPLIEECYRITFIEELGLDVPLQKIMQQVGRPFKDICAMFAPDKVKKAMSLYHKTYDRLHDRLIRAYPGVREVLHQLRRKGLKLAVVTSKNRVNCLRELKFFGLQEFFVEVISSDDCQQHKPHPEPVENALRLLQLDSRNVLFVGDSPYDIKAGKAAGVKTAGITWGISTKEQLLAHQPDFLLQNLNDILPIIDDNYSSSIS